MPQLIKVGDTLYRINPVRNIMEVSRNNGIHWVGWGLGGPKFGRLKDLLWYKDRLLALTETGLWYSRNGGADWGSCGGGKIVESLVVIYGDIFKLVQVLYCEYGVIDIKRLLDRS